MKTLQEYHGPLSQLLSWTCEKTEFQSEIPFEDILRQPRLVLAINHATPLSWVPAMCLLTQKACEFGGGDRIPWGVVDRWFYTNPIFRWIATQISQSEKPQSFDEIVEKFQNSLRTDLVVFPEGAMTFFGKPTEIQDFRSVKFIEIAIRCRAPILIVAHSGSEVWSQNLVIPDALSMLMSQGLAPFSRFFLKCWGKKMGSICHGFDKKFQFLKCAAICICPGCTNRICHHITSNAKPSLILNPNRLS